MDQKKTPQLLNRLNELVERSQLKRHKKALRSDNLLAHDRYITDRDNRFSDRRITASGHQS